MKRYTIVKNARYSFVHPGCLALYGVGSIDLVVTARSPVSGEAIAWNWELKGSSTRAFPRDGLNVHIAGVLRYKGFDRTYESSMIRRALYSILGRRYAC